MPVLLNWSARSVPCTIALKAKLLSFSKLSQPQTESTKCGNGNQVRRRSESRSQSEHSKSLGCEQVEEPLVEGDLLMPRHAESLIRSNVTSQYHPDASIIVPNCSQVPDDLSHPDAPIIPLPEFTPLQSLSSRKAAPYLLSYDDSILTPETMQNTGRPAAGVLGDMPTQFADVVNALASRSRRMDVPEISTPNQVYLQQPITPGIIAFDSQYVY